MTYTNLEVRARTLALATLAVLFAASGAEAQDDSGGLSPTRVKLPQGPGSLEGVGENAEAQLNQGQVSYGVPFALPAGQQGLTPSLGLRYASSGGASVAGLGWTLGGVASIERMTSRGLPVYGTSDLFANDSGAELARVTGGGSGQRVYRERVEGSFARYTWVDGAGTGAAGYWKVETADGRVSYFGARANGTLVPEARLLGRGGAVFGYYLVETVDPYGHRITYDYVLDGGRPYLSQVSWGYESFDAGATARYRAALTYEPRPDVLTDAKSGVVVQLAQRLSALRVYVNNAQLRRYALSYESGGMSGGLSRLSAVRTFGTDDVTMNPIAFSFTYTQGLDPTCMGSGGAGCARPYRRTVGSIGADLRNGDVDFLDMNGDALPDAVNTQGGVHRIWMQRLDAQRQASFSPMLTSAVSGSGSAILSNPNVELLDLDGDGRTDLVDRTNQVVLHNGGTSGDWRQLEQVDTHMPSMAADVDARFLDVDYDRETDVLHMSGGSAWYYRNLGDGQFATVATPVTGLGVGFTSGGLRLADMNGDGMPDVVQFVSAGTLWYYPNLGYGEFGDAVVMDGVPASWVAATTDLVDVSGDGLTDVVQVIGGEIEFALNQDASSFGDVVTVQSTHVDGGLPTRQAGTTSMRYLDMNANGTVDVVYVSPSGQVEYVELYSERPNLLEEISNGIGKRTILEYGTVADQMARDGGATAWARLLPNPMVVLTKITVTEARANVPQVQEFSYRNGYWDGEEHQFRGFEEVWVRTPGDAHVETGEVLNTFDVGVTDRYHRGLALRVETRSNGRVLTIANSEWTDCAVAQATAVGGAHPVRSICSPRQTTDIVEGLSAAETVRTEESYQYDGYGNRIVTHKLGVVSRGGQGCATCTRDTSSLQGEPCGAICVGDEQHEIVDFIVPGSATGSLWTLHMPYRKRTFGIEGSAEIAEERTYYDGADFVGMTLGTLSKGAVHRVEQRRAVGVDSWLPTQRVATDAHGNVVGTMDGSGHRRTFAYDAAGLLATREQAEFDDAGHAPYALRMELAYHPVLELAVSSTAWMRVEGGNVVSAPRSTAYAYDPLGRVSAIAAPGDTLSAPTQEFAYQIASPVSRIVARERTVSGSGTADLEAVMCFDGLGRKFQERVRVDPSRYQVSGIELYDVHGQSFRQYQPYLGATSGCDATVPSTDVLFTEVRRDASHRVLETVHPDASQYGSASVARTVYRPLVVESWDEEDSDDNSVHARTPTTEIHDGLGRVLEQQRLLSDDANPIRIRLGYDALGRIRSLMDDAGNEQSQRHDLLGRVIEVEHPDSGRSVYAYDDANNEISRTDARSATTRHAYDEANRVTGTWDDAAPSATLVSMRYDGNCAGGVAMCANGEGQLVETSYPMLMGQIGRERASRDVRGREVARRVDRGTRSYEFANAYDNADRLVARTFPEGTTLAYAYDGASRLVSVPGHVASVSYDARGLLSSTRFANDVVTEHVYDARLRLSSLRTTLPDVDDPAQALSYAWDRAGNLLGVMDARVPDDAAPTENARYGYDALYRLTRAELDTGRSRAETLTYEYDRIDNTTGIASNLGVRSAAHVGALRYGERDAGPHAVTTVGEDAYVYDAAGQVVERLGLRHTWDHMGRLTSSQHVDDGARVTETAYGVEWTRVEQAERGHASGYVTDDFEVRDGIATIYVKQGEKTVARIERDVDAPREMPDFTQDGRIGAGDAWALGARERGLEVGVPPVDPPSGPQADVDVMLAASAKALLLGQQRKAVTYQHADHLGTVSSETDETGGVTQRAQAYPYGTPRHAEGSGWSRFGYTGMERDRGTGLQLQGSRWLDTRAGRWTRPDSLFSRISSELDPPTIPEAVAPFAYTRNSPTAFVDPSGALTVGFGFNFSGGFNVGGTWSTGIYIEFGERSHWGRFTTFGGGGLREGASGAWVVWVNPGTPQDAGGWSIEAFVEGHIVVGGGLSYGRTFPEFMEDDENNTYQLQFGGGGEVSGGVNITYTWITPISGPPHDEEQLDHGCGSDQSCPGPSTGATFTTQGADAAGENRGSVVPHPVEVREGSGASGAPGYSTRGPDPRTR